MFSEKNALVTGASSGIGRIIAIKLAEEKCNVIIHYNNNLNGALDTKEQCEKYGAKATIIKCDLANENEINEMVNTIKNEYEKVDILVNNAGVSIDTLYEDKNKKNFMKTLEINLVGTFLISKQIGDMMYQNKYGRIINISSTNGIDKYFPMCLDYDASKAALISLTHNLALQYAPYVNVNAIAPGMIATENEIDSMDEEYIKLEEEKIFLKRMGKPEEVADLVLFLAGPKSNYINNEIIRIDGGMY